MTTRKSLTLDKITLRVPRGADPQAVLREVTRALGDSATQSTPHLRVNVAPSSPGEGPQALAQRIGHATRARIQSGDGS
ncbi:MAG: hypothetical protein AAFY39_01905 [Pseudomonadota bacterium]